jgi:hypothetical protein
MAEEQLEFQLAQVQQAKENHEAEVFEKPNVIGVAAGLKQVNGKETKDLAIIVLVENKKSEDELLADQVVAREYGGVKTDIQEVGRIVAQAYTAHIRPARPGYSVGHFGITAGTFGCLVRDIYPPCRVHILSNNHVLANSNAAGIGDPILQSGPHDGGTYPADMIARLSRFVPMFFNDPDRYNLVDGALALPLDQRNVIPSIVGLGIPSGTKEATLSLDVVKSGRTTQTTVGKVTAINATVAVQYGVGVGYFRNQILTTNMSQGGDSGSLLLSRADRKAVGLLFAGSDLVTVHNNISDVLMALDVELIIA